MMSLYLLPACDKGFFTFCFLSCNGIILNYAIVMYDKYKSNIKMIRNIANKLCKRDNLV